MIRPPADQMTDRERIPVVGKEINDEVTVREPVHHQKHCHAETTGPCQQFQRELWSFYPRKHQADQRSRNHGLLRIQSTHKKRKRAERQRRSVLRTYRSEEHTSELQSL